MGPISQRLYDTITGIQLGKIKDDHNWMVEFKEVSMNLLYGHGVKKGYHGYHGTPFY